MRDPGFDEPVMSEVEWPVMSLSNDSARTDDGPPDYSCAKLQKSELSTLVKQALAPLLTGGFNYEVHIEAVGSDEASEDHLF